MGQALVIVFDRILVDTDARTLVGSGVTVNGSIACVHLYNSGNANVYLDFGGVNVADPTAGTRSSPLLLPGDSVEVEGTKVDIEKLTFVTLAGDGYLNVYQKGSYIV